MGDTPDISMFKYHIWEKVYFLDPTIKQPRDKMVPARFLGIAWQHGDVLSYYVRTEPTDSSKRPQILVRSILQNEAEYNRHQSCTSTPYSDSIPANVSDSPDDLLENSNEILSQSSRETIKP